MKSPLCYFHYHGRVAPIPKDKFPKIRNTMNNYTYICNFMFKDTEKKYNILFLNSYRNCRVKEVVQKVAAVKIKQDLAFSLWSMRLSFISLCA